MFNINQYLKKKEKLFIIYSQTYKKFVTEKFLIYAGHVIINGWLA